MSDQENLEENEENQSAEDNNQERDTRRDGPPRSFSRDRRDAGDRPQRRGPGGSGGGGGGRRGRRQNSYCPEGKCFDYKDVDALRRCVTETGKIKPRRQTGNCSRCQRQLAREIKRARHLALLPFAIVTD